jgi:hypothetical protein
VSNYNKLSNPTRYDVFDLRELSTAPVEEILPQPPTPTLKVSINDMVKATNVIYHEEKWLEAIDLYSRCILRDNKCTVCLFLFLPWRLNSNTGVKE